MKKSRIVINEREQQVAIASVQILGIFIKEGMVDSKIVKDYFKVDIEEIVNLNNKIFDAEEIDEEVV